jgi:hypothetical protein
MINEDIPKDERRYFAARAHDRRDAAVAGYDSATYTSGGAALKIGMLVNGGAVVALLAFLSSLLQSGVDQGTSLQQFSYALSLFAIGTGFSGIAAGLTNWRHFSSARSEASKALNFDPPYIHDTTLSKKWASKARLAQCIAVFFGVASILLFFGGVLAVQLAIISLGHF